MKNIAEKKQEVICILGMHRSGTSMTTRLLNICGLPLGNEENLLNRSCSENIKGHWENLDILHINEEILKLFGGNWNHPPKFPSNWQDDDRLQNLYKKAEKVVSELNSRLEIWGFKEPRTCLTLPFWQKVIPNMKYIIPVRHPRNVSMSLYKRDGIVLSDGIMLWITYFYYILQYTSDESRIFTFFDNYFINTEEELKKVCDFIDNSSVTCQDKERVKEFVSGDLRHNKEVYLRDEEISYKNLIVLLVSAFLEKGTEKDEKFYVKEEELKKMSEYTTKEIEEKNSVIEQKTKEIEEKNSVIEQKTKEIEEKNSEIDKKDEEIAEKNGILEERNYQISQKDREIEEKNSIIAEKNVLIKQKEIEVEEKMMQNAIIQNSKSFKLGNLFFRSIKNPFKWITFPVNVLRILFKK